MALFKSRFKHLTFYVGHHAREFVNGEYRTNDPKEIEILSRVLDAVRVDEEEEEEEKAEEQAEPKRSRRKASVQ